MHSRMAENVLILCNDEHMCRSMAIASCKMGTTTVIYTADIGVFFKAFHNTVKHNSVPDSLSGSALYNPSQHNPPPNPQLHPWGQWPTCHPSEQTEISPHFPHSALSGEAVLLLLSARKFCGVSDTTVRNRWENVQILQWQPLTQPPFLLQNALPNQKALNYWVGVGESVYTFSQHIWSLLMIPKYRQISNACLPVENTIAISKMHSCKQPWIYKFRYKPFA